MLKFTLCLSLLYPFFLLWELITSLNSEFIIPLLFLTVLPLIHVSVNNIIFYVWHSIVWIYHNLFIHFPVDGHLGCFQPYCYRKYSFVHSYKYAQPISFIESFKKLFEEHRRETWHREDIKLTLDVTFLRALRFKPQLTCFFYGAAFTHRVPLLDLPSGIFPCLSS